MLGSLNTAPEGTTLHVEQILFGVLREHLAPLGIREGASLRVLARTPTHLDLQVGASDRLALDRGWARFVEVEC